MSKNYSFSRITTYSKCGQMYKLRYIDGMPSDSTTATLTGNICHEVLEELHLNGGNSLEILVDNMESILQKRNIAVPNGYVEKLSSLFLLQEELYLRASAEYDGPDAIRKKDGTVSAYPEMTGTWIKEVKRLNIDGIKIDIDNQFAFLNPELIEISISDVMTDSFNILKKYSIPESIVKTLHTELPISKEVNGQILNQVKIPEKYVDGDDINLVAFIDWIGITKVNGKEGLTIIDYKTNKSNTNSNQVKYNAQLCIYSYAVEKVLGQKVDRIGIHHLRSNTLHLAKVDPKIVDDVMANTFNPHLSIKQGIFKKHMPDSNYSPCLNMYGKKCPYINNCYPNLN